MGRGLHLPAGASYPLAGAVCPFARGVQPTVPASRTLEGIREGRDELLEKAIEVVSRR